MLFELPDYIFLPARMDQSLARCTQDLQRFPKENEMCAKAITSLDCIAIAQVCLLVHGKKVLPFRSFDMERNMDCTYHKCKCQWLCTLKDVAECCAIHKEFSAQTSPGATWAFEMKHKGNMNVRIITDTPFLHIDSTKQQPDTRIINND